MPKLKPQTPSLTTLLGDRDLILNQIVEALDNQDAEQLEISQEVLDEIILPALEKKVDGIAHVLQHSLPTKIAELKGFGDQVNAKRKAIENVLDGIKARLKYLVESGQIGDTITGRVSEISVSSGCYSVDDTEAQPAEWSGEWEEYRTIVVSYKINKTQILADYKAGKRLPPGITIKNGQRLSIKIKD